MLAEGEYITCVRVAGSDKNQDESSEMSGSGYFLYSMLNGVTTERGSAHR